MGEESDLKYSSAADDLPGEHAQPLGAADWLIGPGELGELIRATDWSVTPLGPRPSWPQSLRTVVNLIVESKSPMVLIWGRELRVLYNDPCRAIFADRHPHALGRYVHEVWPEVRHVTEPTLAAVMSKGESVFREDVRLPIDRRGQRADAFFTLAIGPVRVESGSIGGVLITFQETTAARGRNRLLRASEARFRAVVENSHDGINMLDLKTGRYVFLSPAQVALTGFSAEELTNLSSEAAAARVHPDDRHLTLAQQRRIAAGEDPGGTPVEYRWQVKSGEYRWFSDSRGLVRDEHDRPVALVGVSRDITEQKRAQEALRASEQKYAAIFEKSPFSLAISTMPDGAITAVNDAFLRMFEFRREEVLGKTSVALGICDEPSREQVRAEFLARGVVRHFECVRSTRSGAERALSLNLDWVTIGGEPHVLTTIEDITARKEAEDAKRRYEETKALDELKMRFFSSVSHELRTPLALIVGPLENLLSAPDTPEAVRRDLVVVNRNARTLLGFVNNLLDVVKLDAGRMRADYAETDLGRLARLIASHFAALSAEQSIEFTVEGPAELPAQLDREKVQRILLNLLSNAFKFTPAGGRVRLTLRQTHEQALVEVADSGPGIPVERREAVFERFESLTPSSTRRPAGTGLGLSIAREFTQLHGGTITIADAPEGGALFTVALPRSAPPTAAVRSTAAESGDSPTVRPAAAGSQAQPPLVAPQLTGSGDALVLVVEDNPEMNRLLAESLEDHYRVATAFDGQQGLVKALELRPDLVLTDIMMPELSGDVLVQTIRQHATLDATQILVLTANDDEELRIKLLRAGAQDYLTKPFALEELRVRVANLITLKRAGERLRKREALIRAIVTSAADAIIVVDESQQIVLYNQGAAAMFGWTAAEVMGKPVDLLMPERFRGNHRHFVNDFGQWDVAARRMGQNRTQILGLRKNGEEFPIESTISKVQVEKTRLYTVVHRDASERARFEREQRFLSAIGKVLGASLDLSELPSRVARLAVSFLADLCVVDLRSQDGQVQRTAVHAEPAKADLAAALERFPLDSRRPSLDYPAMQHVRSHFIEEIEPETLDAFAQDPEHRRLLLALGMKSVMTVPMLARGRVVGTLGFISSRPGRRYKASDLRLAEELAGRAALAIENAQLYVSAQRAIQARDEVLGVVAHDLRNPLNAIVAHAALQRRRAEPESGRSKPWEMIERAAAKMERLIQDLLDVAQLDAGKLVVKCASVQVAPVLTEVTETMEQLAARAELELRSAASEVESVWADRGRLQQILENLIGNAIKFTPTGGCVTFGVTPAGQEALFWVSDTGAGIAPEELPHLFDRFWQAEAGGSHRGVGLGLFIVKGLVLAHGGRIWAESTRGRGSTFFFTIPTPPAAPAASSA